MRWFGSARSLSPLHSDSSAFASPLTLALTLLAISGITGCGLGPANTVSTNPAAISGMLHGGQQPVSGALIQLIAPGSSGYGSAGSVITSTTTGASGQFTLPRPYTCPTSSGLVYLLATGGNAGAGTNTHIAMSAIVGNCRSLQATDFFVINEVTTIAAAYAFAPFADVSTGTVSIGTSSTNLNGLANVGNTAAALVDVHSGTARAANALAGVKLPTDEVNLLANILASCVNDGATGYGSANCSSLFSLTTPSGGTAPADTFTAAVQIALHPGVNTASLFTLPSPQAPFTSFIATAPNDFALGLLFNASGIAQSYAGPGGVDIDASGNAWVAVYSSASTYSSIFQLSSGGAYLNGTNGQTVSGLQQVEDVAVTPAGNILVADRSSKVFQLVPSSGASSTFASSLSVPNGLAVDGHDSSVWTANVGNGSASHLSSSGASVPGSPYTTGSFPAGVAVDGSSNVWVTNSDAFDSGYPHSSITLLKRNTDSTYTSTNIPTGSGSIPYGVALDNSGAAWIGLSTSLARYSSAGALLSGAGYVTDSTDTSHTSTNGLQIDGLGRAIVSLGPNGSSSTPGSVAVFASDGTYLSKAAGGYGYALQGIVPAYNSAARNLAIDGSGNVWISGIAANQLGAQSVVEIIGMAAPVVTPLSTAVATNKIGVRP
jgi:hypothetical protein